MSLAALGLESTAPGSAAFAQETYAEAERRQFVRDVCAGLGHAGQKTLPCRYFYDRLGSMLFEAITALPEYGLAAADERLLATHSAEMVGAFWGERRPRLVAELGSGSAHKSRHVLTAMCRRGPVCYMPIEISGFALQRSRQELAGMPELRWQPIQDDYLAGLRRVATWRASRAATPLLVMFLGSSFGNFDRAEGIAFLRHVRQLLAPGDGLLLGVDLIKPPDVLLAAYDDPGGVTAAFNLNLLVRMNHELEADWRLHQFQHVARWNAAERRVEMHLKSLRKQRITVAAAGLEVTLRAGETIRTECCRKFAADQIAAEAPGFVQRAQWVDAAWPFAETLLVAQ